MDSMQDVELRREFSKRRFRQILVVIAIVIAVIGDGVLKDETARPFGWDATDVVWAEVVFMIGAVAFSFWNWRCPKCGRNLGKDVNPQFCPKCGYELQVRSQPFDNPPV
jgi:ssDNA-binding Zn-finger/Zn-ribbon topoisomerase 1